MQEIIKEKLLEIESRENVKIIAAIESGSRAWGFASPDSDYDVRFIYFRPEDGYLRLEKTRDVIEWQLDDVLDINGWDIKKTLQLLHNSNPTVFEWCGSPIVYKTSQQFEELKNLSKRYFSPKKSLYHYWHMAEGNYRNYLHGDEVRIKKYLYVLRPILAAKWVIDKLTAPPMLFSDLIKAELDPAIKPEVDRLLEMKRDLPEMGMAKKVTVLNDYIEDALPTFKAIADEMPESRAEWTELNEYFKHLIKGNEL